MTCKINQSQCRRDVLSSIAKPLLSSIAAGAFSTTAVNIHDAQAATTSTGVANIATSGQDSGIYIPGLAGGARFENVIVEEANSQEAWIPAPALVTTLGKQRILARELSPLSPNFVPFSSDSNELYYGKSYRWIFCLDVLHRGGYLSE